jgi:tetrathionate reductase subunit B
MMNRRYFVKGLGAITVYSFLPMPAVFDDQYQWEPFDTTKSGKPEKVHNYAMIIVQDRCIGCKACEIACKAAWNVPKDPELYRTKVLYTANAQSHSSKTTWLPVLCNQCDNPPCVKVCPTRASFKREEDGIVLIRQDKCIGCKTCMLACPYEARYYNDNVHSVDKCTFCLPRLMEGKTTACVESCYKNARIFGDLNDPESEVSKIMKEAVAYHTLKPEEGTLCNVYYTQDV